MIAIGLIGAGIVGFIVGVWSNLFLVKKVLSPPWARCRLCMNAHDKQQHEQWENWDQG